MEHRVTIAVGSNCRGRTNVPHHPLKIERVVAADGYPHVHPDKAVPGHSWIVVQGAEPDTDVVVSYLVTE